MSSWVRAAPMWLCAMTITSWAAALPEGLVDLGRPATESEIAAWDIDVRPDFVGLPPGSGDVWAGEEIWLAQCASCHGDFGDSNEIFAPLVLGNITEEDIATGRVASLDGPCRHPHHIDEGADPVDSMGLHLPGHAVERAQVFDPG